MGYVTVPDSAREVELIRWMRQYGGMISGLCAALLHDAALGQDVAQETFLRAYQKMDSFRGTHQESEEAWLTKIAVNLCRDQWKSRWFRFVDRRVTPDMLPESAVPLAVDDLDVYGAVMALPEKEKQVILLRYYQDMNADEIAYALSMGRTSVYRHLEKALKQLRQSLGEVTEPWMNKN